jgi:hypothetical protein
MAVYFNETIVIPMLTKMRLPRHVLLEMATKIGGERANVREHEPPNVVGFETWRWGTRFFREEKSLSDLGWALCDSDQVAGIRHSELGIKLVCCGTDVNTGNPERSPRNLSERGANSCKLIGRNAGQIEMQLDDDEPNEPHDDLWYYCSYFCDKFISIEVSRPTSEIGGFVTAFSDRIIIAQPGEIPGIRRFSVPQEFAEVPKPQVFRK